ncbi:MAG: 30S ribosomal protein S24e [Candidatus Bathyarchaeia archaeon]
MKIKIVSRRRNPLLKRMEITFEVDHSDTGGTPPRFEVRERLAKAVNADLELVYIKRMVTKTGTMTAFGEANVYDSLGQAKLVEPKHILARYGSPEPAKSS